MVIQTEFKQASTIRKIFGILEEHADQRWEETDWHKVATQIYELVLNDVISKLMKEDLEIASNLKDFWCHLQSHAD